MGFCVASTKNGWGSSCRCPPAVTCFSCMASSRAAWVLGGVRLISSASTTLAKIGPFRKRVSRAPVARFSSMTSVPVMSPGIRSGVNWMRRKLSDRLLARVRTISVLARPGTPSRMAWPPASRQISICSRTASCPTMTFAISWRILS